MPTNRYAKRHYEDVARILQATRDVSLPWPDNYLKDPNQDVVVSFVQLFRKDNPRFDMDRFLETIYK